MSCTVWKRCINLWASLSVPAIIVWGANDLLHTGVFTNIQQMAKLTINQKPAGRMHPKNTESAWETLWFMLVWAIHLGNCVRKTVIVSESTPQTFLKIIGSYESSIWGFGLCWVVKVRRRKMHFYCTAQHKSSYWSMCPLQMEDHKFHMFHTLFYTASQAVRERGILLPDSI